MDVLHEALRKLKWSSDTLERPHERLLELTRSSTGLYIRIAFVTEGRYHLYVVHNGGEKPKSSWIEKAQRWEHISRGQVRERCEKALRA